VTQIEDLVRQALAETPTASATTDPVAALDRRVRRARRRLAAGAGAVAAAIVAAVVVPLAVLGGNSSPNDVQVVTPPTPSPSPLPSGATALWTDNATWATTDSSGRRWLLYSDGGQSYVTQLSGGTDKPIAVQSPADYIVAGNNIVWVIGSDNTTSEGGRSRLTAIDTRDGTVATLPEGSPFGNAAVAGDTLFVIDNDAEQFIDEVDYVSGAVQISSSDRTTSHVREIVATSRQHVWLHSGSQLVEVLSKQGEMHPGQRVDWGEGPLLAPTLPRSGADGIWAYDGRLIALTPSALASCLSCAEGARVTVPGTPSAVVETRDGLFVSVPGSGLSFYSPDSLGSGNTPVTASLPGVQVVSLIADPASGVDYVDGQGNLIHWDPAAAGAR
jgi:hypothetical protein